MTRISWPSTTQVPSFSIASSAAIVSVASVLALADGSGSGGCARSASAVARAVGISRSRRTLRGSFSGSIPLYAAWRRRSSAVHSANSTRMTISRLDPVRAAEPRCRVEHRIRTLDLAHPGEELAARSRAEAAADLAGVGPPVPRANGRGSASRGRRGCPVPAASRRRPPPARAGPSASATTCCAGRARTASGGASRRSPRAPARGPRRRTLRRHPPRGSRSGRVDAVAGGPSAGACAPPAARRRAI